MNEAEDQEVRRRRNPLLWPLRFLLHWIIKTIVVVFIGIGFVLRPKLTSPWPNLQWLKST